MHVVSVDQHPPLDKLLAFEKWRQVGRALLERYDYTRPLGKGTCFEGIAMELPEEFNQFSNGCLFRRADLHIHSFGDGGSYDVLDATMTPEAIVDTAIAENLQVIAITDHNAIGNVSRAVQHARGKPLLVVPGVELSTPQGHFLLYFETVEKLTGAFGKMPISADRKTCHMTIPQLLQIAAEYDGFGIAAHIDKASGLEAAVPKYDAFKQEVLNCSNLLALEIVDPASASWFTQTDAEAPRKQCAKLRCEHLRYEEDIDLAKVMSSDAHSLAVLGRNARGEKRLTRVKMDELTFRSLRIALIDSAARVRLEELVPMSLPHFVGMKLEGGFLKDQVVRFSKNLTCIIGGRGAGKSTMLSSLRSASGNSVAGNLLDSEVWPDAITLWYQDEVGEVHTLSRTKLNGVLNLSNEFDGLTSVRIESYGQGDTAETIQHCDRDPNLLLNFLDSFLDLDDLNREDGELCEQLKENQQECELLEAEIAKIPSIVQAKAVVDRQVAVLKTQKSAEVVALEEKLAKERRLRTLLDDQVQELIRSIKECLSSEGLTGLFSDVDAGSIAVGVAEFDRVKGIVNELATKVDEHAAQLSTTLTEYAAKILDEMKIWLEKEQETQQKIEDHRRELEKENIKLDMVSIRRVTTQATTLAATLAELKKNEPKLTEKTNARKAIYAQRRAIKSKIFGLRQAFATAVNANLAATVVDYTVNVKFHEGLLSSDYEEIIRAEMGWRTSQVPKATIIASQIHPFALINDLMTKNPARLNALVDRNGNRLLSPGEVSDLIDKLRVPRVRVAIARCQFTDRPEIKVVKIIQRPDGSKTHSARDFSQLSLGQQQSVLLSIMLFSKSNVPLIIDQPEDNLDSEFIYKTLVRSLRRVKEHRQVIIVTHNANIAVLGDAELIVPLRASNDCSVVRDRGSIDTAATKELVCTILEGSRKAFERRASIYGLPE